MKKLIAKSISMVYVLSQFLVPASASNNMFSGAYGSVASINSSSGFHKSPTSAVEIGDLNGDGIQNAMELMTTNGTKKLFYLAHRPIHTLVQITNKNGVIPPQTGGLPNYCYDVRTGWISFRQAPASDDNVQVQYKWSTSLDIFMGNGRHSGQDNQNAILYNQGNFTFSSPSFPVSDMEQSAAAGLADFDGDGDLDVALLNPNGSARSRIYINDNNSTVFISSYNVITLGTYPDKQYSLNWGDLNNDGLLDVFRAAYNDGQPNIIQTQVAGSPISYSPYTWAGFNDGNTYAFEPADVDGDGDLDITVGNRSQNLRVFLNTNGTYSGSAAWSTPATYSRPSAVWADMDMDGDLDLVALNGDLVSGRLTVYRNGGMLSPTTLKLDAIEQTPGKTYLDNPGDLGKLAVGDLDTDGDLDVATVIGTPGTNAMVKVFLNNGNGVLTKGWDTSAVPVGYNNFYGTNIRIADMNNDGRLDLIVSASAWPSSSSTLGAMQYWGAIVYKNELVDKKRFRITSQSKSHGHKMTTVNQYRVKEDGTIGDLISSEVK